MLSAVYAVVVCLSVCVCVCVCMSVTLRYCIKMAKRRIMQITPHDRKNGKQVCPGVSLWTYI